MEVWYLRSSLKGSLNPETILYSRALPPDAVEGDDPG